MAFLYVTEQGAVLKRRGQRLAVEKDGHTLLDTPAAKIEGILLFGNVQVTTQAIHLLFQQEIELAFFSSHGRLIGQLTSPATKNIVLRQAQYARQADPSFAFGMARTIVSAKSANSLEFVRQFAHNHPDTDLSAEKAALTEMCSRIESQPDLTALLGLEGAASRIFFQAFAKMLRHSFNFDGRHRRPPPDPVNALLSLGYTLVYNEIGSLLDGLGFDPYLGFYHQPHYGHATLASDLLEEFRTPLVDRFTLGLTNNRILKEDDFTVHAASSSVLLTDESRKRYFTEYERFVTEPLSLQGEQGATDFRRLFRRQAERLRDAVMSGGAYYPFRFCW